MEGCRGCTCQGPITCGSAVRCSTSMVHCWTAASIDPCTVGPPLSCPDGCVFAICGHDRAGEGRQNVRLASLRFCKQWEDDRLPRWTLAQPADAHLFPRDLELVDQWVQFGQNVGQDGPSRKALLVFERCMLCRYRTTSAASGEPDGSSGPSSSEPRSSRSTWSIANMAASPIHISAGPTASRSTSSQLSHAGCQWLAAEAVRSHIAGEDRVPLIQGQAYRLVTIGRHTSWCSTAALVVLGMSCPYVSTVMLMDECPSCAFT